MTFADSNRAGLRYIEESTSAWGVIPVDGVTRQLRLTSSSLAANKETVVSDELRADRMVSSVPEVGATSDGDINFELSAGSQDDFLQAFLLGAWTRPMTFDYFRGNTVAWTANNQITISGTNAAGYFNVGRRIKTEGFNTGANNGYFEVTDVTYTAPNTVITVAGTAATAEAGSSFTKVLDANDVIVLNSTALRLGTDGASTIDSDGSNAFASAIAAGQLSAGQKIFVDLPVSAATFATTFLGFTTAGQDGNQVIITDGVSVVNLTAGVNFTTGADNEETAESFANAVNRMRASGQIAVKAVADEGVVNLYALNNHANFNVTVGAGAVGITGASVSPASNPGSRGFYTIVSASDDVLTVSPQPPEIADPGVVTIKGSMLRNPGDVEDITPQSFTIETSFFDVNQHFIQNGMRVGTFSLDVSSGAIVTGTMAFQGRETQVSPVNRLENAPYVALDSTATEVMNATTNVGGLTKDGEELSTAIQSITIEGDATLRNQTAVGSKFPRGIGTGRFNLTGSMTAYFENLDLYTHFLNHDTISLGFDFQDVDANVYFYTIPAVKLTSDPIVPSGIDQDVLEEIEWSALRDQATRCMLQVDRFSSILPN